MIPRTELRASSVTVKVPAKKTRRSVQETFLKKSGLTFYKLWAEINYKHWYGIGYLKRETFLNWIHICVEVDTVTSTLRASVNGGNVNGWDLDIASLNHVKECANH